MSKLFCLFTYHLCTHVSVKPRWAEREIERNESKVSWHACKSQRTTLMAVSSHMFLRSSLSSFLPLYCVRVPSADSSLSVFCLAIGILGLGL